MRKKTATKYCIYKDGHCEIITRDRVLARSELKRWFILDAEAAFEQGIFIADENGVTIYSDADGKEYTQEEISKMDEWPGGEYVFPYDFTSYRDRDGKLISVEEETIEGEYDND